MNTLRRTQAANFRRTRVRVALSALALGAFVASGCGTATPPGPPPSPHAVGANDPAWIVNRPCLPAPEVDRITYDPRTRTLTLYDLAGNDRWAVKLPGDTTGRPVPAQHRIPDVDPSDVVVYYTRPGFLPSAPVSVKQIQDSGGAHVSFAPR